MTENATQTGRIKRILPNGDVGFIERPPHDVYFTRSHLAAGEAMPKVGNRVDYDLVETKKGLQARNVRRAGKPRPVVRRVNAPPIPSRPAPYTFVPVAIDEVNASERIFDAVLHDGRHRDPDSFVTGELRLTIKALTPLLVGQRRYPVTDIAGVSATRHIAFPENDRGNEDPAVSLPDDWGAIGYEQNNRHWVHAKKTVLEPALVGPGSDLANRRVLLPSSSLKGMLRQSIGAMLGAPMERVAEQYFSYRPNVGFGEGRYQYREAIVLTPMSLKPGPQPLELWVLPKPKGCKKRHAWFVEDEAYKWVKSAASSGLVSTAITNVTMHGRKDQLQFAKGKNCDAPTQPMRLLHYRGGIDGNGVLAGKKTKVFRHGVLVEDAICPSAAQRRAAPVPPANTAGGYRIDVAPEIVAQYLQTQRELSDTERGHVSSRHPDVKNDEGLKDAAARGIAEHTALRADQLIYVEVDTAGKVVSFGRHFRYRWRYADTVRQVQVGTTGKLEERADVHPLTGENVDADGGKLSGARLLFGYAPDEEGRHRNLGDEDYSRLAGRVAFNGALEQDHNRTPGERFVRRDGGAGAGGEDAADFQIPLAKQGSPRASAVEHYLDQRSGPASRETTTYGDLPGVEPSGADLNGRKFYRHQPVTEESNQPFQAPQHEAHSQHGTLARFVSKPGTEFRCTLRFKDLRHWEIGALLVALQPTLLDQRAALLPATAAAVVKDAGAAAAQAPGERPSFAQKLGYGRPLGMGSVAIDVKRIAWLQTAPKLETSADTAIDLVDKAIEAFLELVGKRNLPLADWLRVMKYAGCTRAEYPTFEQQIYSYHTGVRVAHSAKRRLAAGGQPSGDRGRPVR